MAAKDRSVILLQYCCDVAAIVAGSICALWASAENGCLVADDVAWGGVVVAFLFFCMGMAFKNHNE